MNRYICPLVVLIVLTFSGCASIEPTLERDAKADGLSGYIAGIFTRKDSGGFAFALKNIDTNKEYGLALGKDGFLPKDVENQVISIRVPPGQYVVDHWYTYGTLNKAKSLNYPVNIIDLTKVFDVSSNSVLFLGKYEVNTSNISSGIRWSITPKRMFLVEAKKEFKQMYPLLKYIQFNCVLCSDTQE
jgi:hypothetical protein